ncbi:MAG: hypothetical protein WCG79_11580 [Verrucomicrobiota bacterium]
MRSCFIENVFTTVFLFIVTATCTFADGSPAFTVGDREIVATKAERDSLGLQWFIDGNLGVLLKASNQVQLYGANGSKPVRVTGSPQNLFQEIATISIATTNRDFRYLAGGPVYLDPHSKRIFLFYHAEIHRGSARNFYSVLGLSIQTNQNGLEFQDLGPIFMANVPDEKAQGTVEICGAPYMIRDGYFYVYARDVMSAGIPRENNLSVARAKVAEVVQAGLEGRSAKWTKWYNQAFSEPAVGGKSTPLEKGNPATRWMDVSYNAALRKYIMVAAANTSPSKVELFVTWSDDGIIWAERRKLVTENGECFYPSIVGFGEDPRQTEAQFYVYYTFSEKGGWDRWSDAVIARRKITLTTR